MRRASYGVVATLGPATDSPKAARELLDAGATAFRINTSHVGLPELERWLDRLEPLLGKAPVYLDLQGSKWRIGEIEPRELRPGEAIELALEPRRGDREAIVVPHEDFFRAAALSDGRVLLDDARMELRLETTEAASAWARVTRPGTLRPRKGITLPDTPYRCEALTGADTAVLAAACGRPGVRFAVSYVKDAGEMARYRAVVGPGHVAAAKLERPSALARARDIAASAEELWLCRGDLGAEMGLRAMAEAVHLFSSTLGSLPVPVLLAGQVLEHMTGHPTPTRSEVCHLYDALERGYAGVVLSDETAVGKHPVESVRLARLFA